MTRHEQDNPQRRGDRHERDSSALQTSPSGLLRSLRGTILNAQIAHPDVLHLELLDARGERWRLGTQDASWSPADPDRLSGRLVEEAEIDQHTGALALRISGGVSLTIEPDPDAGAEDPPAWELFTPGGLVLEFGPGIRWRIASAQALCSAP